MKSSQPKTRLVQIFFGIKLLLISKNKIIRSQTRKQMSEINSIRTYQSSQTKTKLYTFQPLKHSFMSQMSNIDLNETQQPQTINVKGFLSFIATYPIYKTAQAIMLPLNYFDRILKARQQHQACVLNVYQRCDMQEQEQKSKKFLADDQLFNKQIQQAKKYGSIVVVVTQAKKKNSSEQKATSIKGYMIIASRNCYIISFYKKFRYHFAMTKYQSISLIHKTKSGNKTISPEIKFKQLELNEKGYLELEILRLQAMG